MTTVKIPVDVRLIEPSIRPLCAALNTLNDVRTVYSCEGHPWRDTPPFVMFDAGHDTAFRLHKLLERGYAEGTLKFSWWLTARFTSDGVLRYMIEQNDSRLAPRQRLVPRWSRVGMNREMQRLVRLVFEMSGGEEERTS